MDPAPTRRAALVLGLGLVLPTLGCAGKHRYDLVVRGGPSPGAPADLALAPAVLLHADQLALAPDGATFKARSRDAAPAAADGQAAAAAPAQDQALLDVFYANLYVGKIWHGAGYDLLPEVGNQVRSLELTFSLQQAYAEQAQAWTDQAVAEVLTARGRTFVRVPGSVEAALNPPRRALIRGTQPLDGEDNQNLPGFTLEPQPLDPSALPPDLGAPQLLVPIVVHYYGHNGGWFVGQARGCPAGARFRLLWVLYDVSTGAVLTWGDASARHVQPYFYSPNDTQLQDYLLAVEAMLREALDENLLP